MRRISFVLPILVLAGAVSAQTFPPVPTNGTVYDGAHLLSPQDAATINALSRDFKRDTGAPIVVATFPSLQSVGAGSMGIEAYSTALFNRWRIGSQAANGGILLVISKADRKARIELGRDWKHDYDAGAHQVMQSTIVPAFKKGDYGGGIVRGCQALAGLANSSNGTSSSSEVGMAPTFGGTQEEDSGPSALALFSGLCCLGLPVIILVSIVRAIKRRPVSYNASYGGSFGSTRNSPGQYIDPNRDDDDAFAAGFIASQIVSQPTYDPGPSYDSSSSFDSSSSYDSGSSDSSSSFDSGDSGGGGDTGSW